jgi:hypothetical protein
MGTVCLFMLPWRKDAWSCEKARAGRTLDGALPPCAVCKNTPLKEAQNMAEYAPILSTSSRPLLPFLCSSVNLATIHGMTHARVCASDGTDRQPWHLATRCPCRSGRNGEARERMCQTVSMTRCTCNRNWHWQFPSLFFRRKRLPAQPGIVATGSHCGATHEQPWARKHALH